MNAHAASHPPRWNHLFAVLPALVLGACLGSTNVSKTDPDGSADAVGDGPAGEAPLSLSDGPVVDGAAKGDGSGGADGPAGSDGPAATDGPAADKPSTPSGPAAPCPTGGAAGHLGLISAYWASYQSADHLDELVPALHAGHVDLARLATPLPDNVDVIVDLHWHVFDYQSHTVRADLSQQLDVVEAAVAPVLNRVRAFYLVDEPYLAGHEIPKSVLAQGISAVKARFPGVPTYITFAHDCFDPQSQDSACAMPGAQRGIPAGLDWVGFDWYTSSNDLNAAGQHVALNIAPAVQRITQLAPQAKIMLVPEAYTDGNRLEHTAVATMPDYFTLALAQPAVRGVDFFLWADMSTPTEATVGLSKLPAARALARSFGLWVRSQCGDPPPVIPVIQWYSASGPDYRYETWPYNGKADGYRIDGAVFALAPLGSAGSVPLYHCLISRDSSVDSYLTLDPACDGAATAQPPVALGGIFTQQRAGTVPLHRYSLQQAPWDHVYALSAAASLPSGYTYDWAIGWVYPPSAI